VDRWLAVVTDRLSSRGEGGDQEKNGCCDPHEPSSAMKCVWQRSDVVLSLRSVNIVARGVDSRKAKTGSCMRSNFSDCKEVSSTRRIR
jgi:hypothetical protein